MQEVADKFWQSNWELPIASAVGATEKFGSLWNSNASPRRSELLI
jgi:hypothetical protein